MSFQYFDCNLDANSIISKASPSSSSAPSSTSSSNGVTLPGTSSGPSDPALRSPSSGGMSSLDGAGSRASMATGVPSSCSLAASSSRTLTSRALSGSSSVIYWFQSERRPRSWGCRAHFLNLIIECFIDFQNNRITFKLKVFDACQINALGSRLLLQDWVWARYSHCIVKLKLTSLLK